MALILDMNWLGYGAGLVMTGWVCGMIVNVAFDALSRMGRNG